MKRSHYADMFGPTTGDKVRLGDTSLILEVEKDFTVYGDECKFGGGKVIREGMGQAAGVGAKDALDCVITNALNGFGSEQHFNGVRNGAWIFHHKGDELAQNATERLIHVLIVTQHLHGAVGV